MCYVIAGGRVGRLIVRWAGILGGGIKWGAPCAAKGADRGGGAQLLRYCGAAKSRRQRTLYRPVLS